MSLVGHLGALVLLFVDLALGGSVVEHLIGWWGLIGFEFLLILGYMLLVLQLLPWGQRGGSQPPQS